MSLRTWSRTAAVVAAFAVALPPARAYADSAAGGYDTTVERTRAVPAYLEATDPHRTVRMFRVAFWARAGERRYVSATVVARQPSSTPDSLLMASVAVTCGPAGAGVVNSGATENVTRGAATTFRPGFVYTAPRTGMAACTMVASGLRPRPSSSGPTYRNVWYVDAGSGLSVGVPLPFWNRSVASTRPSRVLESGEVFTSIRRTVTVGEVPAFRVVTEHKVTTCAAVGGSRDDTTRGRELCAGLVSRSGSRLRLVVTASQRTRSGGACGAEQVVVDRSVLVRPDVHHQMVEGVGRVRVWHAAGCLPSFRLVGRITSVRGAAVLVHTPSERLSVLAYPEPQPAVVLTERDTPRLPGVWLEEWAP
jgi:hypothetical protein